MKKHLLLFAGLFILSLAGFAQANLVIFSEDGDQFYAYVNGIRQNDKPETNVKVTGLNGNASLRIEFADKALPQLKQSMMLEPGFEHTARIKRDMKKQLKLRYFGQVPLDEAPASGAATVQYHTAENPYNVADNNSTPLNTPRNNTSVTGSTVTTTTSQGTSDLNNGAVNINMSGTGVNMNVGSNDLNNNKTTKTTTSTTVTSSSSYTNSSTGYNNNGSYNDGRNNHNPKGNNSNYYNQPIITNGCQSAMPQANFAKLKQTVDSKPFSDTKMSTAKVATKNGCLSTAQVKELCNLFSMDDDRLAYAKYAYAFCVDKANYYQVSETFKFSSTTDAFNKFLEGQ